MNEPLRSIIYTEGIFFVQEHDTLPTIAHTTICLVKEDRGMKSSEKLGKRILMRKTACGQVVKMTMMRKIVIQNWRGKLRK
jgi:hypothetical protein